MTVQLQIRKNGGSPASGAISAVVDDVIQLTASSMATWKTPVARWIIYDFPETFSVPAGWSTDASGYFYYDGNVDPPSFTIPAGKYGKYMTRLIATEGGVRIEDKATAINVPYPSGLSNIGRGEGAIFGGTRKRWAGTLKAALELLNSAANTVLSAAYEATPGTLALRNGSGDIKFVTVVLDAIFPKTGGIVLNALDAFTIDFQIDEITTASLSSVGGSDGKLTIGPNKGEVVSAGGDLLLTATDDDIISTAGDGSFHRTKWDVNEGKATSDFLFSQVKTTDGTQTNVLVFTPTDNTTCVVDVEIAANNETTTSGGGFRRIATVRTTGNVATLIGAVTSAHTARDDAAYDATIDVSGGTVRVRVTGKAATNLRWEAYAHIKYAGQYTA